MGLQGIDISEYQGDVDFAKVKASGIGFVSAKASEVIRFKTRSLMNTIIRRRRRGSRLARTISFASTIIR